MELSIIIPTRQEEAAIAATIAQFKDLSISHEVIVADCGSTDETVARATPLADRVVVFTDPFPTAGKNRNQGAAVASGTYLLFIDSGVTIPDPEAFMQKALAHFKNRPDLVGVAMAQSVPKSIRTLGDTISFAILNTALRLNNNFLGVGEASGKGMMVTREAYLKVNGFREDIHTREDGDFFARVRKVGKTLYDGDLVVYHDSRRAHAIGWTKLWWVWLSNAVYFAFTDRVLVKDWTPFR